MKKITWLIALLFLLLFSACAVFTRGDDIIEVSTEQVREIADSINFQSEGLLKVPYAEILLHAHFLKVVYGVHYNVFIIKRADLVTLDDRNRAKTLVGEIFQLTTERVLSNAPSISHVGIQVFDPDVWLKGGHKRGRVTLFIAPREKLLELRGSTDALSQWLEAAVSLPMVVIFSSKFRSLINELNEFRRRQNPNPKQSFVPKKLF